MDQDENKLPRPSILQMIFSVLAAMVGVQKSINRERDFKTGNPWLFILVGISLTVIFVLILIGVVSLVLNTVK